MNTDTLPPLPDAAFTYERQPGGFSEPQRVPAFTAAQMKSYASAAIAAHAGNIAAVPAQPVATSARGLLAAWQASANVLFVSRSSGQYTTDTVSRNDLIQLIEAAFAASPQAVPVPAGWSVTYDGKRASYIYADQETAEFEAQQVGGTARAVAVYLAAAPKEQPHE